MASVTKLRNSRPLWRGAIYFLLLGLTLVYWAKQGQGREVRDQSAGPFDGDRHEIWAELLDEYVVSCADGINRVRYAEWTDADRQKLDTYIDHLTATKPEDLADAHRMAFWINLYNALTVQVILEHYPVDSIRDIDISPGLFSDGPWGAKLIEVADRALSLDNIEHDILREEWDEPRIHYAVNCAAAGCPNLAGTPYRGGDLETQLDASARAYINHRRGVSVSENRLLLSSIFKWYGDDFGDGRRDLIAHIRTYAAPPLRAKLSESVDIADYRYNWALNDAAQAKAQCQ